MNARDILDQARDALTVRRVFGEPIERDGLTLVPVAAVTGGGGGGGGRGRVPAEGAEPETGFGGGWGGSARPVGVFVISQGSVRWEPAVDVGRIVVGAQIAFVVGLLVVGSILRIRATRRRG